MTTVFFWSRIVPVACMFSLSIGQIMFKLVARSTDQAPIQSSPRALALLSAALLLYAVTTLTWVVALRYTSLSKAYPILALAYVFVPIGAFLFLGERVSPSYWGGVVLLVIGLALIARSQVSLS